MKNKFVSLILIICMLFLMITGCGNSENTVSSSDNASVKITMASNPFVGLAPIYIAIDKGFFTQCGIDFSLVNFDDSSSSCSALLSGKVDIAYACLDAAIIAQSQYTDNKLKVTDIIDESAGADGIIVKNDINCIQDLKGKTIGVSINQTAHYLLMQALKSEGLTDTDVNLINMTSSDAGVSFISGDLDAAVTWEPYLSNAISQGAGKIIFSSADAPGSIIDVLAVQPENKDADWLPNIKKAIQMGLDYLNSEETREEAISIVASYLEVEPAEAESMLSTIKLYDAANSAAAIAANGLAYQAVNNISDFYYEKEIINAKVPAKQLME